jgi:predicted esterase
MHKASHAHLVTATVHGRYLFDSTAGRGAGLLVGFHGYAELADAQMDRLRAIPGSELWVLASVQALHPFYRGRSNDVVASWMTRLDREQAIADNVAYVGAVVADIRRRVQFSTIVYAGFSQGVAMAFRAALRGPHRGAVIALGGDVPPELKSGDTSGWRGLPVLLGRGTQDPWLTEDQLTRDLEFLRAAGAEVTPVIFDSGHEWAPAFCAAAGEWLMDRGSALRSRA